MIRHILTVVLAATTGNALAAWSSLGSNDAYAAYISDISVPKPGNVVETWTMNDYTAFRRTSRGSIYWSRKLQGEYDCARRQSRIIYSTTHADRMGGGRIISTSTRPDEWRPAPVGSFDGYVLDRACSKTQRPSILSR
jgi:hypothetical protein